MSLLSAISCLLIKDSLHSNQFKNHIKSFDYLWIFRFLFLEFHQFDSAFEFYQLDYGKILRSSLNFSMIPEPICFKQLADDISPKL